MQLELRVRNAKLKPDQILKIIEKRFNFNFGIPYHVFGDNTITTSVHLKSGKSNFKATCSLSVGEYNGMPCFVYTYKGPVRNEKNHGLNKVEYTAYIFENVRSCGSTGGKLQRMMINRVDEDGNITAPPWFPISDEDIQN